MSVMTAIFGCDCDPDRVGFTHSVNELTLSWRGIEIGIPAFMSARHRHHKQTGVWPKMTWFVRADDQIKRAHGDAGYCLATYEAIWRTLEEEGDEIAWHPHLWAWNESANHWYQRIDDAEFTQQCLEDGLDAFDRVWGRKPTTVHTGWCYQDNQVMAFMSENGLLADCSAVPGHNTLGRGLADQADWGQSSSKIYFPDGNNYQLEAPSFEERLNILEVPASVGSGRVARALKIIRDQVKRRSIRLRLDGFKTQVPLMTLSPLLNRALIKDAIHAADSQNLTHFLSYTHADEFLHKSEKSLFPKLTYSLGAFFSNLTALQQQCRVSGFEVEFKTLNEFARELIIGDDLEFSDVRNSR